MKKDKINYDKLVEIINPKATILKTRALKGGITAETRAI